MNEVAEATASVRVNNIGGIEEAAVNLKPGVNVLVGRNATNRTSFLQSLMAVCGSERATLKGDAEQGRVQIDLDGETFTRGLSRHEDSLVFSGDPILENAETADLFAFLLENNEVRRAVATGGDLRDLVMRPVDTAAIQEQIEAVRAERERIDDALADAEEAAQRLPEREHRRVELEAEIEEKREAIEEKREEIEAADAGVEESQAEEDELDAALERLNDRQSELERVESRLETERESLASVREERAEVAADLEATPQVEPDEVDALNERAKALREQKRTLDSTVTQLQSLIQFNEEMLDGEHTEALELLSDDEETQGAVTDALLPGAEHQVGRCWTCGSEVSMNDIEDTVETLRSLVREKRQERSTVESELEDVQSKRKEMRSHEERREDLAERLDVLDAEIGEREETIERLASEREELEAVVDDLEETVEELEAGRHSAVLEHHREANQLQFELDNLQDDLEEVSNEIVELRAERERVDELEDERDALSEKLAELRTRIERLEVEAVEAFNEHIETVLGVLEYENVERVWIEQATEEVREDRRRVERSTFRLHVVRTADDGTAYEDTVDHLSESEREVIGLVFGLAGYLVHEVYEAVPFMLLDSLEALDSTRIAALVEYFEEYAPHVIVALLPEDARALDDRHRRVTEI